MYSDQISQQYVNLYKTYKYTTYYFFYGTISTAYTTITIIGTSAIHVAYIYGRKPQLEQKNIYR